MAELLLGTLRLEPSLARSKQMDRLALLPLAAGCVRRVGADYLSQHRRFDRRGQWKRDGPGIMRGLRGRRDERHNFEFTFPDQTVRRWRESRFLYQRRSLHKRSVVVQAGSERFRLELQV